MLELKEDLQKLIFFKDLESLKKLIFVNFLLSYASLCTFLRFSKSRKIIRVINISKNNLPWKLNHKFTRQGCSSFDRISTSLATFFRAPRSAHSFLCTYFMAYILPVVSRFCTIQTC